MKQTTTIFEIGCIALLLLTGISLSWAGIDNTGILSVAALLSLLFASSHHKAVLGLVMQLRPKQTWSASPSNGRGEL